MGGSLFRLTGGLAAASNPASGASFGDVFADDVLVGFPSVAALLDRMRGAFVDEGSVMPLSADVRLSPQQAFVGATVPIDLPVRCTCRDCHGTGEYQQDRCCSCLGSGVTLGRHQVLVSVPSRVADGACFHLFLSSRSHPSTRLELRVAIR